MRISWISFQTIMQCFQAPNFNNYCMYFNQPIWGLLHVAQPNCKHCVLNCTWASCHCFKEATAWVTIAYGDDTTCYHHFLFLASHTCEQIIPAVAATSDAPSWNSFNIPSWKSIKGSLSRTIPALSKLQLYSGIETKHAPQSQPHDLPVVIL